MAQDTLQRKIILLLAMGSFQPFELEIGTHIALDSTTSGAEGFSFFLEIGMHISGDTLNPNPGPNMEVTVVHVI